MIDVSPYSSGVERSTSSDAQLAAASFQLRFRTTLHFSTPTKLEMQVIAQRGLAAGTINQAQCDKLLAEVEKRYADQT